MVARHRVASAVAAVLAVSLAGCSGSGDGTDPPTTPATVSFPDDPYKAPSVPNPIDPTSFIDEPCTSLGSAQQRKFGLDRGEPEIWEDGAECVYHYTDGDRWIRIYYATRRGGLQDLYDSGPSETRWEPQVLDGYPAVARYTVDRIAVPAVPPSCSFAVGVNDSLYFSVLGQDSDGSSECGLAKTIAADVLANIKKTGEIPR